MEYNEVDIHCIFANPRRNGGEINTDFGLFHIAFMSIFSDYLVITSFLNRLSRLFRLSHLVGLPDLPDRPACRPGFALGRCAY